MSITQIHQLSVNNSNEPCLQKLASKAGVEVYSPVSHTLFNPDETIQKVFSAPCTLCYQLSVLLLLGVEVVSLQQGCCNCKSYCRTFRKLSSDSQYLRLHSVVLHGKGYRWLIQHVVTLSCFCRGYLH